MKLPRQEYWSVLPFPSQIIFLMSFWIPLAWPQMVLEKILESPLHSKEIKPVNPKGNQSWIFIRRTDAETEAPILWPLDGKSWLIRKNPNAGNDWRQEEKGMTEDKMVGWHHWLNGHEFEQAPGDGDEQGNLACCSPWGCKESDTIEQMKNNKVVFSSKKNTSACKVLFPSSAINAKKYRKTTEWERLEMSSRKLEIPREHFMWRWAL